MTTPAGEHLPPFAEPYHQDFIALERMLSRVQGFTLQPVEAPSPDLAHVFSGWLRARGWDSETFDLKTAEQLEHLTTALQNTPTAIRRVLLVVAANDLDASTAHAGLAAVNWARDRLVDTLACPVLWWGNKAFLRMTWEHAPDLWSIAGSPFRIPLRRLEDVPAQVPYSAYWWTGVISTEGSKLEAAYQSALAAADSLRVAQTGLRLAEAQLLRKDPLGARETLARIRDNVIRDARHLIDRFQMLEVATSPRQDETLDQAILRLRRQIDAMSVRVDARQTEAVLRLGLAELLESAGGTNAVQEYARAREITMEVGDVSMTLSIDFHLTFNLWLHIGDELREKIPQYAASVLLHDGAPRDLAIAALILSQAAHIGQDLIHAEELALIGIHHAKVADQPMLALAASPILAAVALERGNFTTCLDHTQAWIDGANAADNLLTLFRALEVRARAFERLEQPVEAARTLWSAANIAERLELKHVVGILMARMGRIAQGAYDDGVAASLVGTSLLVLFRFLGVETSSVWRRLAIDIHTWTGQDGHEVIQEALILLEQMGEDSLDNREDDQEQLGRLLPGLRLLGSALERLNTALAEQGVEPLNPDTWRVAPVTDH